MARREVLLAAIEQSPAELLALAANAAEALQGFSAREVERLSDAIAEHVRTALVTAGPALEAQLEQDSAGAACSDGSVMGALETLTAAAAVARAVATDPSLPVPATLAAVACALHDIIFDLHDPCASTLQAGIVSLCEAWWLADRPGRDELVPQTISYLLVSALHEQATAADVKRLWAWRGALGVLDYSDPSVGALKKLLLHCAIKPLVLRCAEGRKLLVHLFGLHPPFIADLHRAIRAQLPACRKSLREIYGEIYFKAWRAASGPYLDRIEQGCLQDLMFHAVHASSASMSSALRQVLNYTHTQKRQRGVDGALLRLYEPILWRALSVANADVRRNAATVLIEVFPLQDPALPLTQLDELLQRQFDALTALLKDDAVAVRVVAVQESGVCRILALYWDLIPSSAATPLLLLLTRDLAHDAAANAVRAAVPAGLKYLLQNGSASSCVGALRGSAAVRSPLSHVAPLVHDTSQRVRTAALDLAIEVAKVRGLNWQTIFRPDALLTRLPLEPPPLQQRLARLLLPLHIPAAGSAPAQLGRLLELCATRRATAAALLKHMPKLATPAAVVKVLKLLLCAMLVDAPPAALLTMAAADETPEDASPPSPDRFEALAAAAATLLDASGSTLLHGAGTEAEREALLAVFSAEAVSALYARAADAPAARAHLVRLAAWLPAAQVPHAAGTMRELSAMPHDAPAARLAPLIQCACAWDLSPHLLAAVTAALGAPAEAALPPQAEPGTKRGRPKPARAARKAVAAPQLSAPPDAQQLSRGLALRVLWAWQDQTTARAALLDGFSSESLAALRGALAAAATQEAEAGPSAADTDAGAREPLLALACCLQLSWHAAAHHTGPDTEPGEALSAARAELDQTIGRIEAAFPGAGGAGATGARTHGRGAEEPPSSPASLISPGEARGRARPRTAAALAESNHIGSLACAPVKPAGVAPDEAPQADARQAGLRARLLLSALLAEASVLGLLADERLATRAVSFVAEALRTAAAAAGSGPELGGSEDRADSPLGQLLPHAAKLGYQLVDCGGLAAGHGEALLAACVGACTGRDDATMRATLRTVLLEVLAVHAHSSTSTAPLLDHLLRLILPHVAPASDPDSAQSVGISSLGLPVLLAQTLELLARSAACEAELPRCAAALGEAAGNAPASPGRGGSGPASLAAASARLVQAIG